MLLRQKGQGKAIMELDKWLGAYKVRSFPWIDGRRIYFNVQYYAPGQSIERPPAWDKTVYITDNEAGQQLLIDYLDSFVEHVANMSIPEDAEVTLTV